MSRAVVAWGFAAVSLSWLCGSWIVNSQRRDLKALNEGKYSAWSGKGHLEHPAPLCFSPGPVA